jgi:hypothetical protein
VYQWYVSTYVVSYVKLVANSSTTKAQSTGLAHDTRDSDRLATDTGR